VATASTLATISFPPEDDNVGTGEALARSAAGDPRRSLISDWRSLD
jgi:hypothetical protein